MTNYSTQRRFGGEGGIRTHGTQKAQRFSRPPDSNTLAPLLFPRFITDYCHLTIIEYGRRLLRETVSYGNNVVVFRLYHFFSHYIRFACVALISTCVPDLGIDIVYLVESNSKGI